jgi:hypothetical protein
MKTLGKIVQIDDDTKNPLRLHAETVKKQSLVPPSSEIS